MKTKLTHFYNKKPIEFIHEFEKGVTGTLKSRSNYLNGLDNVDLKFDKQENEYELDHKRINKKTKKHIQWGNRTFNDVTLQTSTFDLVFERLYSWDWFTAFTNTFYTKGFKKHKKYFKFIIPLEGDVRFHFQLEEFFFSSDFVKYSRTASSFSINDEDIFILKETVHVGEKKKHYLIIESNKKQLHAEFTNKVYAIRVTLGYIIGDFRGVKGYTFSYSNKKKEKITGFIFQTLRKDTRNLYQPINSNPYAWLHSKNRTLIDKIHKRKQLRTLTYDEFSTMVKFCLKNEKFLSVLLLMIESGNKSLLVSPVLYFIVLEQLSNLIVKSKPVFPINNLDDANNLKGDLINVVKKFEEHYTGNEYDFNPIKKRVEHINQSTNNDKLKLCFEKLEIKLSKEDEKVLNARNSLLHGNTPYYKKKKNRTIEEKDSDLYYTSVRIYTLLNILILKYIGYDNYVINFTKIYEKNTGYLVDEEFYRKV